MEQIWNINLAASREGKNGAKMKKLQRGTLVGGVNAIQWRDWILMGFSKYSGFEMRFSAGTFGKCVLVEAVGVQITIPSQKQDNQLTI